MVLAATNRIQDLDEALLRRFRTKVLVPCPTFNERREMLLTFLNSSEQGTALSEETIDSWTHRTEGWTGHDIQVGKGRGFF